MNASEPRPKPGHADVDYHDDEADDTSEAETTADVIALDRRPNAPTRRGGAITSAMAGATARIDHEAVLAVLGMHPDGLTDQQLVKHYEYEATAGRRPFMSESGIRSRRAELVGFGVVANSGRKAKTAYGRSAVIWTVVPGVELHLHNGDIIRPTLPEVETEPYHRADANVVYLALADARAALARDPR